MRANGAAAAPAIRDGTIRGAVHGAAGTNARRTRIAAMIAAIHGGGVLAGTGITLPCTTCHAWADAKSEAAVVAIRLAAGALGDALRPGTVSAVLNAAGAVGDSARSTRALRVAVPDATRTGRGGRPAAGMEPHIDELVVANAVAAKIVMAMPAAGISQPWK